MTDTNISVPPLLAACAQIRAVNEVQLTAKQFVRAFVAAPNLVIAG